MTAIIQSLSRKEKEQPSRKKIPPKTLRHHQEFAPLPAIPEVYRLNIRPRGPKRRKRRMSDETAHEYSPTV
ncbi:MAG: hypothetical protein ABIR47_03635 [Candidatus Kapaibacterium sp.]